MLPTLNRSIVLVGLMGAGKSSVGRRLAKTLEWPFIDADDEIVKAAGCSIEDIFELYGEAAFREGEKRVILRLLEGAPIVLATGGGAFINPEIRATIKRRGVSVWLRAELSILYERTSRRAGRPLLKSEDPRAVLKTLIDQRYPVYAEADIEIESRNEPHEVAVKAIIDALRRHMNDHPQQLEAHSSR
ncbi:shikimate kinase [Varunaivibrio sulfuroxidans]|uniref:Shikimate kinase n=1 Tax=Varunaivibrio sulfuroxidans TaxID=1773489 RepID=A0A4R3JEH6_9PROT|nr:shikimate kinase [Varunaivibrio sulfuroxidans]